MLASAPRRCAGHLQPTSLPLLSHESPILPLLRQAPSRGLPSREAQGHRLRDLQVQPEIQGPPRRHPGYPPFQERPVKHVIPTVFPRTKRLPGAAFFVPALMRAWSPRGRCVSRQSVSGASRAGIPTSPPPENFTAKTRRARRRCRIVDRELRMQGTGCLVAEASRLGPAPARLAPVLQAPSADTFPHSTKPTKEIEDGGSQMKCWERRHPRRQENGKANGEAASGIPMSLHSQPAGTLVFSGTLPAIFSRRRLRRFVLPPHFSTSGQLWPIIAPVSG